jgi:hypothetical protein
VDPVTCREGENVEECERARRNISFAAFPSSIGKERPLELFPGADLALKDESEEGIEDSCGISKPESSGPIAA